MDPINDVDNLLNLDGIDDQTPPAAGDGTPAPGDPKPADDVNKKLNDLSEANKNLTEQMRQVTENNKTLSNFRDKVVGNTDEEKDRIAAQERAKNYEEDPVGTTQKMIREELSTVKDGLNLVGQTGVVDRAMRQIDENYDINWDKDYQKVKDQLKKFSDKSIKEDPEGTLLASAKLAGVAKKRENPNLPSQFERHRKGGNLPKDQQKGDDINSRLDKYANKKKDNVFGI